ncbi:alpha/beta fold hydrolase [Streptomyces aurantiacus]|uniref:Putative Linear gramicidin dehydrogenase LgrE n=1 Tax=Streptomyces aurantiacus JA 4570 TaxID=1286094 RepID=S3ZLK7_9ACTN|nr:alpha/beta fold hydrolase [Streptomyces aurantiacus]EPH43674.1 putative Linear gramicidin dehydrogenase LgrE [Streptomyces aurantiacus JA 4570]
MPITERPPAESHAWFTGPGFGSGPELTGPEATPAATRLICFSYAGGTPSVYRDWPSRLGPGVTVVPVLLPGRGLRLDEVPYTDMAPLARDVTDALLAAGHVDDYALFGHSMGALLAYEVACALRDRGRPGPRHLFVSGSKAPHLYGGPEDQGLGDDDLRQLVGDLGALAPDDWVGRSYLERRLPVLRADLTLCARYRWRPRRPLDCPMTAFSAAGDPIAPSAHVEAWRAYTSASMLHRRVPGGHFYLNGPARLPLLRELRAELTRTALTRTAEERNPSWTC